MFTILETYDPGHKAALSALKGRRLHFYVNADVKAPPLSCLEPYQGSKAKGFVYTPLSYGAIMRINSKFCTIMPRKPWWRFW